MRRRPQHMTSDKKKVMCFVTMQCHLISIVNLFRLVKGFVKVGNNTATLDSSAVVVKMMLRQINKIRNSVEDRRPRLSMTKGCQPVRITTDWNEHFKNLLGNLPEIMDKPIKKL